MVHRRRAEGRQRAPVTCENVEPKHPGRRLGGYSVIADPVVVVGVVGAAGKHHQGAHGAGRRITIGQSADPDDAFMAWGLASGTVSIPGTGVECVFDDIQTLNEWALESRLDLTALSAGTYPRVASAYRLLRTGASFGEDYGPLVVAKARPDTEGPAAMAGLRIAVPGLLTTAYLLLRTYAGDTFKPVPMRFDPIIHAVVEGTVDAGLIIHEAQLTYRDHGLHALFEPARAWHQDLGLPVPLGV
ncbi:MAG: hypothetical protein IIA55_15895, partial [Gemmatimonadetes bacterium]|nr:hypothetical protein [Gemmatimonadota bacterium]